MLTISFGDGTQIFSVTVIPHLTSKRQVGREAQDSFSYVGLDFVTLGKKVQIHQEAQHLLPIPITPSPSEVGSLLTEAGRHQLRSKIGHLLGVARQTRPDVMFDASNLASNLKQATVQTFNEAKRATEGQGLCYHSKYIHL